ncbi:MAG: M20 family peptidase [Candidatus Hydrogenedentota bacterium]
MKLIKRILGGAVLALVVLAAVLVLRTFLAEIPDVAVPPFEPAPFDEEAAVAHLAEAVQIPTISHRDPGRVDTEPFARFHAFLEDTYPRVHATLARETVNGYGLLYTWEGSTPDAPPVILLAHQDVVPVEPGTQEDWAHPPFSGTVSDGHIWGRGTLDDKGSLIGILEAVEALIGADFVPARTIYLCFGHDEEVGGHEGAAHIAQVLAQRGVTAYLLLDEGLAITQDIVPGVSQPVALVGVAEKGYLTVALTAAGEGGHSSTPPPESAVGMVARAVARLEENPMPARLDGPMRAMLEWVGPAMDFPLRLVMANLWLFEPLVTWQFAAQPATNAGIRTTTAPTMFEAGTKENVLAQSARAVVNFRIMPGESIATTLAHVRETIGDARVTVTRLPTPGDPSPVSPAEGAAWEAVTTSIRQVFPEAVLAPGLMLGGTDTPHYQDVTQATYRFLPVVFQTEDLERLHGTNERLAVNDYLALVRFYQQLMRNAAG